MSEFKFACPVCGQHMMCDVSQAGSVMDCPTCFQKIVAPQAPADETQKLILTGTKLETRAVAPPAWQRPDEIPAKKGFPLGVVILLVAVGAAGAGLFAVRGKIFNSGLAQTPPAVAKQTAEVASAKKNADAPVANDANWSLEIGTNAIPDAPVAGRIHGQNFLMEHASFQNGALLLRAGTRGPVEFAAFIHFGGAPAESLAGKTLNILADTNRSARVTLRWKDADGTVQRTNYDINYAMRLEFSELANNRLPGKIYLCTPDAEKSYLLGSFNASVSKPKLKKK